MRQSHGYVTGQRFSFKRNDPVICNGYPGTIVAVKDGQLKGMVEVRLPGGEVCVSASYPDCYPDASRQK